MSSPSERLLAKLEDDWNAKLHGHVLMNAAPLSICVLGVLEKDAKNLFSRFCTNNSLKYCPVHIDLFRLANKSIDATDSLTKFLDKLKDGSFVHIYGLDEQYSKPLGAWDGLLLGQGWDLPNPMLFVISGALKDTTGIDGFFMERVTYFHRWS